MERVAVHEESGDCVMDMEKVIQELEARRNYHRSVGNNISADIEEDAIALLKEYQHEKERKPVIVCPHCGKRVV